MHVPPREVLLDMLRLDDAEVAARARQAGDPEYWRTLAPAAIIGGDPAPPETRPADAGEADEARASLNQDGVFHLRGVLTPASIVRVNAIIDLVTAAGWPAVFAFVYDDPWLCARAATLLAVATRILGAGCAQLPHVWTHIVGGGAGDAGWAPHVDGPGEGRLSIWVALTDAALDDGCIHVVTKDATAGAVGERFRVGAALTGAEAERMLQSTRAMPAAAGDALGWTFDVVHWGGRKRPSSRGRRSLSFEFIDASVPVKDEERPLVPLGALPPFHDRIRAIAAGVLTYGTFEAALQRYEGLARQLAAC